MKRPPGSEPLERARGLRRDSTDVEKLLWSRLRARQVSGAKFRRQVWLAGYIADFLCAEARLVIELDGGQHALHVERDVLRTAALAGEGYRVLRFWNHEVIDNLEGVMATIAQALPLPPGEGR
jgi:very-short-patch-repair endonuclease